MISSPCYQAMFDIGVLKTCKTLFTDCFHLINVLDICSGQEPLGSEKRGTIDYPEWAAHMPQIDWKAKVSESWLPADL